MNQEDHGYTQELEQLLEQYEDENSDSFARIIELSMQRIQQLAHYKLLNDRFVHADIQTDDLFQSASMRLYKAMKDVHPRTKNEFLLLVGTMIRREILDTARRLRKRCRICRTTLESDAQIDLSHLRMTRIPIHRRSGSVFTRLLTGSMKMNDVYSNFFFMRVIPS